MRDELKSAKELRLQDVYGRVKSAAANRRKHREYHEYLRSNKWKAKRKRKQRQCGYRCEICGSDGPLDIHHKHYRTVGRESLSDLMCLCRHCHEDQHCKRVLPTDEVSLEFRGMFR